MPAKALTHCKHPRCGALVKRGYCDAHKPVERADRLAGQRGYNTRRAESDRLYSTQRWKKLSVAYKRRHPICIECENAGRTRATAIVDHIKPAKLHPELFWDWGNLRALCFDCHARIGEKVRA